MCVSISFLEYFQIFKSEFQLFKFFLKMNKNKSCKIINRINSKKGLGVTLCFKN